MICCDTCPYNPTCEEQDEFLADIFGLDNEYEEPVRMQCCPMDTYGTDSAGNLRAVCSCGDDCDCRCPGCLCGTDDDEEDPF